MFVYLSGICHSKQPKFPYNSQITIPTDACFPLHLPTFAKDNITDSKMKKNNFCKENFNAMAVFVRPCCISVFTKYSIQYYSKEQKRRFFYLHLYTIYFFELQPFNAVMQ